MIFIGFNSKVYEIVSHIPEGKVVSYGQVASMAGNYRASRAVGYAMHGNPYYGSVPCHRVVFQNGNLTDGFAFGGKDVQRQLLEAEGVTFTKDGYVNMKKCRWDGTPST
ncbi:MGMT family protein [Pelosinus sp. sgz500959]|uniref:MGMT family protein n=1 Tax=Pelosinus sp. sgz500959 TaxID=3242472 RepID=UPI00366F30FC